VHQLSTAVRADADVSEFEIESAGQQDELDQDVNTQENKKEYSSQKI